MTVTNSVFVRNIKALIFQNKRSLSQGTKESLELKEVLGKMGSQPFGINIVDPDSNIIDRYFLGIRGEINSMTNQAKYKVNLIIDFPFESEIIAVNEDEAVDKAMDKAMEYLESRLSDSHKFDEFWEYKIQHKILKVKKNQLNQG